MQRLRSLVPVCRIGAMGPVLTSYLANVPPQAVVHGNSEDGMLSARFSRPHRVSRNVRHLREVSRPGRA